MKIKKKNLVDFFVLCFTYFLMLMNYKYTISEHFEYLGFTNKYYTNAKLFVSISIIFIFVLLLFRFKNDFYKLSYSICLIMLLFGQSIYYIFNNTNFILVLYMTIPLVGLCLLDKIDREQYIVNRKIKLNDKPTLVFLILVTLILISPSFKYYKTINLKNLLLIDVYETRLLLRDYSRGIVGYLFSPLSRVILPFFFVYSINIKNTKLSFFVIINIMLMYLLNGALKSIFFGFLLSIFFMKGNYNTKKNRLLKTFMVINLVSFLEYITIGSIYINDYLRRIVYVPAHLFQIYYDTFFNGYTYFKHSKIASIFGIESNMGSITMYVGEVIMGKRGLNANVGIFVEGFLSLGTIGVILASIIFVIIIYIVKKARLDPSYFGIFAAFIYVINTSFVEPLFISHGLLFYIVFAYLIIPRELISD